MTQVLAARPAPAADDDALPKSVLGKAQLLLGAFRAGPLQMRLTELSQRSGVPKATAYRLAQELVQWGLLERVEDRYQLGLRLFELGRRVPVAAVLSSVSRPHLTELYADTRALVSMSILDGGHVMYVERIGGAPHQRLHADVGARFPASCTASGKLLLALHPAAGVAVERLSRTGLARPTSRSVSSCPELGGQLAEVRRCGHAVEVQETVPGWGAVAVPVRGADGLVYAAIAAAMPMGRLTVDRLVPRLRVAALTVSRAVDQWLVQHPGSAAEFSAMIEAGTVTL